MTKQHAKSLAEDRLHDLRKETRESYACDFKEGFERAYVDLAEGGTGVTPTVPPERYWGYRYRTPEGHERAQEWFRGYEMGASYAEMDGLKDNAIATSARRYGPFQKYCNSTPAAQSSRGASNEVGTLQNFWNGPYVSGDYGSAEGYGTAPDMLTSGGLVR